MLSYLGVSETYYAMLFLVVNDPEHECAPRGQRILERRNAMFVMDRPRFENVTTRDKERNAVIASYTEREMALYRDGTLDAARWRDEASRFWWEIRNPDDTINSNYGYLSMIERDAGDAQYNQNNDYETQWEWARRQLIQDHDTRQAYVLFSRPRHQWRGSRDVPCTMHGVFHRREGLLHYTVVMRSQDVWRGAPYDLPFFCWQLETMAQQTSLTIGTYTHFVHSLHAYETHLDNIRRLLR